MCRWLAYSGSPVLIEDLLYKPQHSLIVQSMRATMGVEPTNGDGFGLGWYGDRATPGLFRSTEPAWNDRNLRDVAEQVTSRCVLAHIRASTGTAVQFTNCHPFRHGHRRRPRRLERPTGQRPPARRHPHDQHRVHPGRQAHSGTSQRPQLNDPTA